MKPKDTNELLQELATEMAKPPREFEPKPPAPLPTEAEINRRVADALEDLTTTGEGVEYL
jgi:hypothetical protein